MEVGVGQCAGYKQDNGDRCGQKAKRGSDFCAWHQDQAYNVLYGTFGPSEGGGRTTRSPYSAPSPPKKTPQTGTGSRTPSSTNSAPSQRQPASKGGRTTSIGKKLMILLGLIVFAAWGCERLVDWTLVELGLRSPSSEGSSTGSTRIEPALPAAEAEHIEQHETAIAALVRVEVLADNIFARNGTYADVSPDVLNELIIAIDEQSPVTVTGAASDSPSTVSVSTPTTPDGSWAMAVWSPFGCVIIAKHPMHGTYQREVEPDFPVECSGNWARQDFDRS